MKSPPGTRPPQFAQAIALLRQGKLAAAEAACHAILKRDPRHFDALHLAGMLATQAGKIEEAVSCLRRALAINPKMASLHFNLGLALIKQGALEEALASLDHAQALDPKAADAAQQRGEVLLRLGKPKEALAAFDHVIALTPNDANAHHARARALSEGNMLEEALAAHQKALSLQPESPDFLTGVAVTLCHLKRHAEAQPFAEKALQLSPNLEMARLCLVDILLSTGRFTEALAAAEAVVAAHPRLLQGYLWRSNILTLMGQPEHALALCAARQGIALDEAATHINHGFILGQLNRLQEGLVAYDAALKLKPDNADAQYNRAFALLTLGRFEEGWLGYEYRNLRHKTLSARAYHQPIWWGKQPLKSQRLFIYWEQGLGDTIQFSRYALLAAAAGAKVALSVQEPLRRLFQDFDPAVTIMGPNEIPTEFDLHCPILSLPLAFGTRLETIPAWPEGYLKAPPDQIARWAQNLPAGRRRIGLVWSGSTAHTRDALRSIPFSALAPLLDIEHAWVSLQKEVRDADLPDLRAAKLLDPTAELSDFADTAALIAALDLVIAVDTSVAHLAAALGKPTWLLVPFAPDFRWLLKREDSPWYPSMRLFRQHRPGDWDGVIARVAAALQA
jgi:tetratricopeptide (TPR) repeat protein